jgi:hypothetical protein
MLPSEITRIRLLIGTLGVESTVWSAAGLESLYSTMALRQRVEDACNTARRTRHQARWLRLQSQLLRGIPVERAR